MEQFVKQWDRIAGEAPLQEPGPGEEGKPRKRQYADLDALHWFNYLAFDSTSSPPNHRPPPHSSTDPACAVIGDLAFGAPFDMLPRGADVAEVRTSPAAPPTTAPAIQVLNRRGEVSATLGCLPWLKPYAAYLPDPFFRHGMRAVHNLAGIAVARVRARLDGGERGRSDLLARLMQGRDAAGNLLGREELTAEALTQLIAGSDTTSNTLCALLYHVLRTEGVQGDLHRELDAALPDGTDIPSHEMVRDLPW